ncbi:MAG TPA: thioesterase family protein [Gemmatimonadota bacterium]
MSAARARRRETEAGVVIQERVRWSDVDAAGIACYGAYLRFYEIAETELFRAAGEPYHEVFERYDVWLPRVHVEAEFRRPAFLDDLLRVRGWVERIGRTSLHLAFRVERGEDEIARARFVMVSVGRSDLAKTPLPAPLAERLGRFSAGRSPRRSPARPGARSASPARRSG